MNECSIDVCLQVKYKNKNGKILTENFITEIEVPCSTYTEECHGFHTMYEFDDKKVSARIKKYIDELEIEDIQYFLGDCEIDKIYNIKEVY